MKIIKVDSCGRISLKKICKEIPLYFSVDISHNKIILTPIYDQEDKSEQLLSTEQIKKIKEFIESFVQKMLKEDKDE
jgi:hypothetical protein